MQSDDEGGNYGTGPDSEVLPHEYRIINEEMHNQSALNCEAYERLGKIRETFQGKHLGNGQRADKIRSLDARFVVEFVRLDNKRAAKVTIWQFIWLIVENLSSEIRTRFNSGTLCQKITKTFKCNILSNDGSSDSIRCNGCIPEETMHNLIRSENIPMECSDWLESERTRHHVGWLVAQCLAASFKRESILLDSDARFSDKEVKGSWADDVECMQDVIKLMPEERRGKFSAELFKEDYDRQKEILLKLSKCINGLGITDPKTVCELKTLCNSFGNYIRPTSTMECKGLLRMADDNVYVILLNVVLDRDQVVPQEENGTFLRNPYPIIFSFTAQMVGKWDYRLNASMCHKGMRLSFDKERMKDTIGYLSQEILDGDSTDRQQGDIDSCASSSSSSWPSGSKSSSRSSSSRCSKASTPRGSARTPGAAKSKDDGDFPEIPDGPPANLVTGKRRVTFADTGVPDERQISKFSDSPSTSSSTESPRPAKRQAARIPEETGRKEGDEGVAPPPPAPGSSREEGAGSTAEKDGGRQEGGGSIPPNPNPTMGSRRYAWVDCGTFRYGGMPVSSPSCLNLAPPPQPSQQKKDLANAGDPDLMESDDDEDPNGASGNGSSDGHV